MQDPSPTTTLVDTTWKILIVDDDEDDFFITREMLNEAKGRRIDVHWANTYTAGREKLASDHYSAVLVDYDLGVKSGIEFIRETNEQGQTIPLILYTGRGNYEVDVEAMEAGATLYLSKGEVNALLLERAIRYAIERKQIEAQLKHSNERLSNELAERQRAEEQLRKSNEALRVSERMEKEMSGRFQAVLENSPDVVYRRNLQTDRFDYMSPVVEQILGFTAGELMTMSTQQMLDRIHPEDLPSTEARLALSTEYGQGKLEYRFLRKDGSYRWLADYITVTSDKEGNLLYRTGVLRDVTEQVQLLEQGRQQKDLLERLVKSTPAGIAFLKGPQHVYYLVNDEYRRIARGKGDLIGRSVVELWPEVASEIIPQLDQVYQTGEPFSIVDAPLTIFRDGIPENNYFTYTFTPIFQSLGTIEGVMILAIETTDAVRDRLDVAAHSARMAAVLQALPVGVWITDASGRIIGKNQRADQIWAGDAPLVETIDQYQQYQAWDVQSGKKLEPEEYPLVIALQTGQMVEQKELRIRRFDGSEGYVFISAAPIMDQQGQVLGAVAVNMDITERVQVELARIESETHLRASETQLRKNSAALRESEERFRRAIMSAPFPMMIRREDGQVMMVNDTWTEITGYAVEDIPTIAEWTKKAYGESAAQFQSLIVNEEYSQASKKKWGEIKITTRGGAVRIWDFSSADLGRDPEGRSLVLTMAHDVTERSQAEQALRKSEEKFAKSFMASPVAIAISTVAEGRFVEVSESYTTLFEFSREELIGQTSIGLGMFPDPNERKEIARRFLAGNGFRNYELQLLTKSGKLRDVLFSTERIEVDGQDCMLSLVIDITERKQVEAALTEYTEKLKHSNQELEQFAFIASHDLQEPLRKIILFGERLQKHPVETQNHEVVDYVQRMQNAAVRMRSMVDGLLELSRVNTRGGEFAQIRLNNIVGEVVSDLEARVNAVNGLVLVDELPTIEADELQMHQLFQNLIGNAIKFHKPGVPPVVHVSGKIEPTQKPPVAEFHVCDNGIGFEQHYAEQIFQPFRRLHGRNEYEGTGLGLAICKKIVERHHGVIEVHSEPGKGTTFSIRLPVKI